MSINPHGLGSEKAVYTYYGCGRWAMLGYCPDPSVIMLNLQTGERLTFGLGGSLAQAFKERDGDTCTMEERHAAAFQQAQSSDTVPVKRARIHALSVALGNPKKVSAVVGDTVEDSLIELAAVRLTAQQEQPASDDKASEEVVAVVDRGLSGGIGWTEAGRDLEDGQELFTRAQPPMLEKWAKLLTVSQQVFAEAIADPDLAPSSLTLADFKDAIRDVQPIAQRVQPAVSNSEPQAQAGEPEVVALRWPYKFRDIGETGAYEYHSSDFAVLAHLPLGEELITLQSHREAMEKETAAATNAIRRLSDELFQKEEAITKKDAALKFYADGDHFIRHNADAWDTVSGEPQNLWCDEADTATVEDGSIARGALK